MLRPDAKLAKNIFEKDLLQKPLRDGFGEGLILAGEADQNVVVLSADLTESTRSLGFAKKFPERFVQMGVAEQNLAAVAAGMAAAGKIPFISSYAMFSPGRNWEQIRTTACYNDMPVKIAGAHAGISVGPDGATHQALEDMAIMRAIPNMTVLAPCDMLEAKKATLAMAKSGKPAYIRLAREKTPVFTTEETPFAIGKAEVFFASPEPKVAIIACGPLVHQSLRAAEELAKTGIGTIVLDSPSVKPLDEKTILEVAGKVQAVVTVEEHQMTGGLGGAVAEFLGKNLPRKMAFIAVQDSFGESGTPAELLKKFHLETEDIIETVKRLLV